MILLLASACTYAVGPKPLCKVERVRYVISAQGDTLGSVGYTALVPVRLGVPMTATFPPAADALLRSGVDARNRGDVRQATRLSGRLRHLPQQPPSLARDGAALHRLPGLPTSRCDHGGRGEGPAPSAGSALRARPSLRNAGDYDQALYWHNEAIRIYRKRAISRGLGLALMGQGSCYARLGDYTGAHLSYERALKVHDTSPAHRFGRGITASGAR
jgi:tetratricopeptide (TPR) repeat protein